MWVGGSEPSSLATASLVGERGLHVIGGKYESVVRGGLDGEREGGLCVIGPREQCHSLTRSVEAVARERAGDPGRRLHRHATAEE